MAGPNGAREKWRLKYLRLFRDAGVRRSRSHMEEAARTAAMLEALKPDKLTQRPESLEQTRRRLVQSHIRLGVEGRRRKGPIAPAWLTGSRVAIASALALLVAAVVIALVTLSPDRGVASLKVYRGEVTIQRSTGDKPETAKSGTRVEPGDRVITGADGLVEVGIDNGALARLDGASEISIRSSDKSGSVVDQYAGNVFHVAVEPSSYSVHMADVTAVGGGAVFNMDRPAGAVRTRVFEKSVKVSVDGAEAVVDVGYQGLASLEGETPLVAVSGIDAAVLQEPWYLWNLSLDQDLKPPPGNPRVSAPPVNTAPLPPSVTNSPATPGTTTTTPSSSTTPTSPSSSTSPSSGNSSVTMQANSTSFVSVRVTWSVSGSGSYDSVSVLRVQANGSPVYPANNLAGVSRSAVMYVDRAVAPGNSYTYRVCLLKDGVVVAYSNPVLVSIPSSSSTPSTNTK